ncbi:formate--tetrahydrofolate ligase [Natrialbaceae archaeon AArc-T1-2]|uniref:formate--tetrahydrofolate ligase n=1 Tax=Natrialbaceae archaeon AArc-T1-2 TaxID=3053904 RepID=UPI00255AC3BB|nr:formate--tetrahydrofolate ligase [Natrialbaceae archaeon AArc-T1-2]WIV66302.1 formate--tetrahydrofolate ligase [Natrialbaceae archaeon AArc-T1-2]
MPIRDSVPSVPSDLEIARSIDLTPIEDVATTLGLSSDDLERYGDHKAKLTSEAVDDALASEADGTLVFLTAMTATPAGAGKTVTGVGLGQALERLGERVVVAIREPSQGPVFGIKGGAAGGGYSQVLPMEEINLHFTGDIHAVTAAHNLIAATLDAHVHHGNDLGIDVRNVDWKRALDVNDRALRETVVGLGGSSNGVPREDGFLITAASEVMAVLCLASDLPDLKRRIGRIVVAADSEGEPVTVDDLAVTDAVATLLSDALRPNLVGTVEGTPAFVHGGPFANIAHGTNTLVADRVGLALADYVVTEGGFAADLGFEKFANVVAREGVVPDVAVLVATVRGLKHHGLELWPIEEERLAAEDVDAVRAGFENLAHHAGVLERFGVPYVVAINRFADDTVAELEAVLEACEERGMPVAVSAVHARGGEGGIELAEIVRELAGTGSFSPLYDLEESLETKLETVAREVYGAADVAFTDDARADLERLERDGFGELPVCVSKTQHSLTDDPAKKGAPEDWTLTVRELYPSAGAGFVVALTGDVLTMPGLPADPAAEAIELEDDGTVHGLF